MSTDHHIHLPPSIPKNLEILLKLPTITVGKLLYSGLPETILIAHVPDALVDRAKIGAQIICNNNVNATALRVLLKRFVPRRVGKI